MALEQEVKRLGELKTSTETIHSSSERILDEIRKMATNLEKQIDVLRESVADKPA